MKMVLRNREKKVFGLIATILFLAGLHFMVFSRKATEYTLVMNDWKSSRDNYEQVIPKVKNPEELKKVEARVDTNKKEFEDVIEQLRIDLPKTYIDPSPEAIKKRQEEFTKCIDTLLGFQDSLKNTKLSFIGEKGWNLPRELPENIRKRPERLWDVMSSLSGISAILKVVDNPNVRDQNLRQYSKLLEEIGIDEPAIEGLNKYGKFVPLINRECHYKLIISAKPKDIKFTDEQIQEFLRLSYPNDDLLALNKQLFALNDIIQMAETNKIEDITEVQLKEMNIIKEPPKPGETPEPGEQNAPMPEAMPFAMAEDPEYLMMMHGEMGEGGRVGMIGRPRPASPGAQAPPPQNIIATGIPILMRFTGSNFNITHFLYNVSHVSRSYELDSLIINTIKEREGVLDAYAFLNVLRMVEGVVVDLDTIWEEKPSESGVAAAPVPLPPGLGEAAPPPPGAIPPGVMHMQREEGI